MIDEPLREELNALLDGELEPARADELRARLDGDAALRAEYDRLRRVRELVRGLPPARANLSDDVLRRLPPAGRVLSPWGWIGGVLAAAAATVLGVVLLREDPGAAGTWSEAKDPEMRVEKGPGRGADSAPVDEAERGFRIEESRSDGEPAGGIGAPAQPGSPVPPLPEPRLEQKMGKAEADAGEAGDDGDRPAKVRGAPAPTDLLRRVEQLRVGLDKEKRKEYLTRLAGMEREPLQAHLARVGDGRVLLPPAAKKKSTSGMEFEIRATNGDEAALLRRVLARAYRSDPALKGGVAPSTLQAEGLEGKGGELRYAWEATPLQLGAFVTWLDRIGLSPEAQAGVRPSRLRVGAGLAETLERTTPVRVRIRFGNPAPPPAPEAEEDK